eukprot:TRINITY_DN36125_c0_g1_i1.p1 TRINITY_DN36125_c0_g1~~TRINITY_DN36125_c0_g1_i1.p1  ORF type:complete len:1077 (-),score=344.91 TRINITY_DN36125_c0_g1_i1:211-3441(-)
MTPEMQSDEGGSLTAPLHLLRPSEGHGSLLEDSSAMRFLEDLQGEVSVVSIVGQQRGGKSTLMNLLHGRRLTGFQMGHYLDPKTSGLWVWARPHPWKENVTVLLVDSEGLDSPNVPEHYNWLLSALTLLLSDVFMYQSRSSIEQSQADRLDMILRVAEQLGRENSSCDAAGSAAADAAPGKATFLWLLRDHQMRLRGSPKEELLGKLDMSAQRILRRCFRDCDCVPLPRPAKEEDALQRLDTLSYEDLSPEFREEFVVFERHLLQQLAQPRTILGSPMTGRMLVACMRQYLATVSSRVGLLAELRQMPSQRELLLQLAGDRAVKAAIAAYAASMNSAILPFDESKPPCTTSMLLAAHGKAQKDAQEAFQQEADASGLEEKDRSAFETAYKTRIARWSDEEVAPGKEEAVWRRMVEPGAVDGVAVALGDVVQQTLSAQVICRESARLHDGLLHDLWMQHSSKKAAAERQRALEMLKPLEARVAAALADADGPSGSGLAVESLKEFWTEARKIEAEMTCQPALQMFHQWATSTADRIAEALQLKRSESLAATCTKTAERVSTVEKVAATTVKDLEEEKERRLRGEAARSAEMKAFQCSLESSIAQVDAERQRQEAVVRAELEAHVTQTKAAQADLQTGIQKATGEIEATQEEMRKTAEGSRADLASLKAAVQSELKDSVTTLEASLQRLEVDVEARKHEEEKMKSTFEGQLTALEKRHEQSLERLEKEAEAQKADLQKVGGALEQQEQQLSAVESRLSGALKDAADKYESSLASLSTRTSALLDTSSSKHQEAVAELRQELQCQRVAAESLQADVQGVCGDIRTRQEQQLVCFETRLRDALRDAKATHEATLAAAAERLTERLQTSSETQKEAAAKLRQDLQSQQKTVAAATQEETARMQEEMQRVQNAMHTLHESTARGFESGAAAQAEAQASRAQVQKELEALRSAYQGDLRQLREQLQALQPHARDAEEAERERVLSGVCGAGVALLSWLLSASPLFMLAAGGAVGYCSLPQASTRVWAALPPSWQDRLRAAAEQARQACNRQKRSLEDSESESASRDSKRPRLLAQGAEPEGAP